MITYKIHLIRHGMTEGNRLGQYIGVTDMPLSPDGVNELIELKGLIEYPAVQQVYASPMLRCRQTANILFPGRDQIIIDKLREYDFGLFEGKTANELESWPEYKEFIGGKITAPPQGEDTGEFTKRLCIGLREIVTDMMNRHITSGAAVMHGGTIMALLAACGLPRKRLVEWAVDNGRGYTIMITPSLYQRTGAVEVIDAI